MAFFVLMEVTMSKYFIDSFQRPERALFISTWRQFEIDVKYSLFQRPKRALLISTSASDTSRLIKLFGFNALNGLSSFLLGG